MGLFSTREDQSKTTPETIYPQIQCTPLVDVLFISIGNRLDNVDRSTSCEIYGKVRVLDTRHGCENELFSFFNKDEDNPECVHFDEPLLLTTPSPTPVIGPSKDICLDVHLFDRRANNMVVACEKIILDKRGDECEEFHDIEIESQEDNMIFARVHYTIIQYAVAATIDVLIFSKDDKFDLFSNDADAVAVTKANATHIEEPSDKEDWVNYDENDYGGGVVANVFGTVRGHSDLKAADGEDWRPILLFNKSASQGVEVKSGGFIQLSRSVVILPAYSSSLVIEVDLFHCEGDILESFASNNLEFKLRSQGCFKKDIVGEHGGRVRVRVTWNKSYIEEIVNAMFDRQSAKPRRRGPEHWLEMFSVVVHRKDFKPLSFYGKISVLDWKWDCIFDNDKKHPQICPESGALLTLKGTHSRSFEILGYFLTVVDLRDTETGDTISMGTVQWDDIVIQRWLDQRLCSIVRGEKGFAAVHYTTFYDGIIANLDMKLGGKHLPGYVYGKIVARYTTYEYSTTYDKYYQITVFDSDSEEYESQQSALTSGSNLPLLKPDVCLARGSSLIVEANLRVSSKRPFDGDSQQGTKFLQATVELNPKLNPDSGSPKRLGCEQCFIDVHVRWD
ncbi:uncharacterized protein LOC141597411 [Silene latifolia]|uniref:uncharacterized protein LOC141597411 n=1 Tax=Silene latifolia TaxID=37657 RepID=UPI003D78A939